MGGVIESDGADSIEGVLLIGPDANWFRLRDGGSCNLRRRRALRAILRSLVHLHRDQPGVGLSIEDLLAIGWPGERVIPYAGANRVYVALTTLRNMGLRGRLILQRNGYMLDPELHVEHIPDDARDLPVQRSYAPRSTLAPATLGLRSKSTAIDSP